MKTYIFGNLVVSCPKSHKDVVKLLSEEWSEYSISKYTCAICGKTQKVNR